MRGRHGRVVDDYGVGERGRARAIADAVAGEIRQRAAVRVLRRRSPRQRGVAVGDRSHGNSECAQSRARFAIARQLCRVRGSYECVCSLMGWTSSSVRRAQASLRSGFTSRASVPLSPEEKH